MSALCLESRSAGELPVVSERPLGDVVRAELAGSRFGDVRWVSETGSTNTDALELGRQGEPEGVVLVADHQTAGRGRLGRTWEAPVGGSLLCTILLRPPPAVAAVTTVAVAVAAADAVADLTGCEVKVKWPNDLVWPGTGTGRDRKLAGILAEVDWPAASQASSGWRAPLAHERLVVAVGIGINVAWGTDVPADLAHLAVALDHITDPAPPPDRADLLISMLRHLDRRYGSLLAGPSGVAQLRSDGRERSATLGSDVRVELGTEDVVGMAVDITDEGHLVVRTADGRHRTVAVGDVVHLRPTSPGGSAQPPVTDA